jgi:ABC-type transport system substrate-binding protein
MIGSRLNDRYEVTRELGRGGMGVVYHGRDSLLNRDVAVKLIPPALLSPEAEQRFQREAQVVAQMDHPAIVSIFDLGRHEGALFFVMPLVQGTNLHQFRKRRSALGDIVDIGIQIAEALEYSHGRGVVHRDVKPDNVMVSEEAGGLRVRVMDFGLARVSTENRLTKSGALMGTLAYLSPEQVLARDVDGRSDVYSLGVVLYECIAGTPPFQGDAQSVLYRIVHELPQSPRALGAEIDEELDAIVLGCLEKEPGRRPARAGDVAEALRRYRSRLRDSDRGRALTGLTLSIPRPVLSPFVGRAKESGELQRRLNAAVAGESQFVVVGGEPGIGKTRLLDELEKLAHARQIRVLHGRSVDRDRAFAYQGFCEIIQEHFRGQDRASAPPADLSDVAADLLALFPMLHEISEIRSASASSAGERPAAATPENKTQVFELLARAITRLAAGRPLVLFLEDLHGAEATIEALSYVVTRLSATPTLIVGTYRTTEVDDRHPLTRVLDGFRGDRRFAQLTLGPFSPSEHRSYVETLVGGPELSDRLVERLYDSTKGNLFFTKELVRSLLDAGGISRDDSGQWSLSGEAEIAADALPATIQEAVEKRIRRLPEELRELLSLASVLGKTFESRDLESLAKGTDVDDALDRLVQEGLLEEERESRGEQLSFSSGVVRDMLYAGLSPRKRRSLHRRCGEALEARLGARADRVLPQLVQHFYEGDVPEKAVEYGLRLARASLDAFSVEEAVRSAKTVLDCLDEDWRGERVVEGEVRLLLARAERFAGHTEAVLQEATDAAAVFEAHGRPGLAAQALLLAAETAWQARRSEEAGRWAEQGVAQARAAGETASLPPLLSLAATVANLRGDYAKANGYLEEAGRLAPEPGASPAEEPVPRGGRLVVGLANPVRSLEPATLEISEELDIVANVFETLIATDGRGNLSPALCEKWQVLEGGRAFLLTLRAGVSFSDGSPLTARDVKASIEACVALPERDMPPAFAALRGSAEHRAGRAAGIDGLVARGDEMLELRLLEPLPIYPALLTEQRTAVARRTAEGTVGTGPFRFKVREPERIVLERNPGYWRAGLPRLDELEFRAGLSASALARGFRAGEIDLARDLLPEDLEATLRDARFRRGRVETPTSNTYFVLFNCGGGPVARSEAVRRALCGVVRTSDLVWRTLGRFAAPAVSLIPPGLLGHDPGRRGHPLTLDEARAMLAAAGVGPGSCLRASVHPAVKDRYGALLAALRASWAELGVEIVVETADMGAFLDSFDKSEGLDLLIGRWNTDYPDPDNIAHGLFHSGTGHYRSWYSAEAADRLLDEARSEARPAVREALYRRFEGLLSDAGALLPLFHDIDYRLAAPKVRGLALRSSLPSVNFAELGVVESQAAPEEVRAGSGGVLHVPLVGSVNTVDPAVGYGAEYADVIPCVYETLTRDAAGARIVPWLAAEFHAEDGGQRYRFRLRDDVRFHDGRRLGARDVRYSFERLLLSDSEPRWLYSAIRGARALLSRERKDLEGFRIHSASEFSIELAEPVAFFPALVAYENAAILPEGCDPSAGAEGWVGTGPFRVTAFEPGRRLELERNRSYWRKGYPRCERIEISSGVPPAELLAGFRAGRFALAGDIFPADAEALRREPAFAGRCVEHPRLTTYFAAFNVHRGPLSDRALRRRLVEAVDVPALVRRTLGRLAVPAASLIPPGLLGHDPTLGSRTKSARAADTLAGLELTATVHPVFSAAYSAFARELASGLGQLGAAIRPVAGSYEQYLEAVAQASTDLLVGRWNGDYPDADTFAYALHSQGGFLGRFCGSAELDRLIAQGRTETTPAVRHAIYREIEETVAREALLLPLFHEQAYRFARPEVDGLSVSALGRVALEDLSVRG